MNTATVLYSFVGEVTTPHGARLTASGRIRGPAGYVPKACAAATSTATMILPRSNATSSTSGSFASWTTMTLDRWCEVNSSWTEKLTDQELKEGWHFCVEFDGLLVGPGMGELNPDYVELIRRRTNVTPGLALA